MSFEINFANFSVTTLSSNITSTQDSFNVSDGSILPDSPFVAVIFNPDYPDVISDPYKEIIYVGVKIGNVLSSVVRGYENTINRNHSSDDYVAFVITAGIMDAIKESLSKAFKEDSLPSGDDGDIRLVDGKVYIKLP